MNALSMSTSPAALPCKFFVSHQNPAETAGFSYVKFLLRARQKVFIMKVTARPFHRLSGVQPKGNIMQPKTIKLLKIFVSSTDVVDHGLLYEKILRKANQYGVAGGTAIKGAMGYGISSKLRNSRYCELVEKFPVVVEFIDTPEKIEGFLKEILPWLEQQPKGCLVSTQNVDVYLAKKGDSKE